MAKKTVFVCDVCGAEIENGKSAVIRVVYADARRGATQADACIDCAGKIPGHAVKRRGRPPAELAS